MYPAVTGPWPEMFYCTAIKWHVKSIQLPMVNYQIVHTV